MTTFDQRFLKALHLLDRGRDERAVELLEEVVADGDASGGDPGRIRALVVLAEVRSQGGETDEAHVLASEALTTAERLDEDAIATVAEELAVAHRLIAE